MGRELLAALLVLGAVACAAPEPAKEPILRFIEEPAPPVFEETALVGEAVARSWSFSGPPPGRWQLREIESVRGDGVSWWLAPQERRATLDLDEIALVAADIDAIAVAVHGRALGGATLHWGPAGEPLEARRQLQLPFSGQTSEIYLFEVGRHPEWSGEVGRLMLTLWTAPGTQVGISSVKAVRRTLDDRKVEVAIHSPWRVDLRPGSELSESETPLGERRLALIGWPGRSIEKSVDLPAGAELRLAYGVRALGGDGEPLAAELNFRVEAEVHGELHELAERRWRSAQGRGVDGSSAEGWRSLQVDLSPWAGSRIRLKLSVDGEDWDPRRGIAFWGHPEILAPAMGEVKPSVVLIVADTLRADRLSLYGHGRPTSPNLEAWAHRHGAVFESVVSSAGWTLPSHVSIFTGLDAPGHGVNWPSSRVDDSLLTLAEVLYAGGYVTEAITGGGYLDAEYGLDRGFMRYRSARRGRSSHESEPAATLRLALDAMSRLEGRPYFLFVHTYATHAPYAPWQPHFSGYSDQDPLIQVKLRPPTPGDFRSHHSLVAESSRGEETAGDELTGLAEAQYDAGIARLDGLLGPVLEKVAGDPRILTIFTSDHGEMLGESGFWDHGHILDPALKVPLIVSAPGRQGSGRRLERPARTVDLMPTILDLLGQAPPPGLDGRSLAPRLEGLASEPPPVAWSYGRRVDEGLTLRLRDRLKLVLHDDLLYEGERRIRAFEVGSSPRQEREIEMPEELAPFVEHARRKLLTDLPGLHLRFANDGDRPLRFELSSGAAVPERIKVVDLDCPCISWRPPVGLEVEVPTGKEFTVVLTDVRDARLQMTLKREDGSRQRLTLDLTEHDRPLSMAVIDQRFEVSAGAPPASGVGVRWNESRLLDLDELDRETLESLRALGYVE